VFNLADPRQILVDSTAKRNGQPAPCRLGLDRTEARCGWRGGQRRQTAPKRRSAAKAQSQALPRIEQRFRRSGWVTVQRRTWSVQGRWLAERTAWHHSGNRSSGLHSGRVPYAFHI